MLSSRPVSHFSENQHATKTPARGLLNRAKAENAMTVGRTVNGDLKAGKTPFNPKTIDIQTMTTKCSRPLVDKTPFPNRTNRASSFQTPLPGGLKKLGKLPLNVTPVTSTTPGELLRPSSTRKHARAPRSANKNAPPTVFQTPDNNGGNHWDVVDEAELEVEVNEPIEEQDEHFFDEEIEYMPPTAFVRPYEPAFDLPNYTQVGRAIREFAYSYPVNDGPPPVYSEEGLVQSPKWEVLALPDLEEEDPFALARAASAKAPVAKKVVVPTRGIVGGVSRTASTRAPSVPTSRAPSTTVRAPLATTRARPVVASTAIRPSTAIGSRPQAKTTSVTRPATASGANRTVVARPRPAVTTGTIARSGSTTTTTVKSTPAFSRKPVVGASSRVGKPKDVSGGLVFGGVEDFELDDFKFDV